jgi:YVTN family beta-propeller protein
VSVVDTETNTMVRTILQSNEPLGLALFEPAAACLSGVVVAPDGVAGFGRPSTTVVYTETVLNLTGSADSFDLAISGHSWPTTLSSSNTGIVPDGGSASFTVEVVIPPGADPGDMDGVTVTATSANNPTSISDTAALHTKALSDQSSYVFDNDEPVIHVVDTVLHAQVDTIETQSLGGDTLRGALSPDGTRLYAGMEGANRILVVDASTNTPQGTIPVGRGPHGIAFSADGAYALVANQWDDTVSVIDTGTSSVALEIPVNSRPMSVASSACLDKVYVTNRDASTVSVIDPDTLTVTHVIEGLNYPWDIVISPLGDRAYVSNQGGPYNSALGSIGVIDTASDSLIATWPVGGKWIAGLDLSADGQRLYVVDTNDGFTRVVDTATGQTLHLIPTDVAEGNSWEVESFAPGAGSFAYTSNPWDGSLSVVDTNTNSVVDRIWLGGEPRGLALFPPISVCGVAAMAAFTPTSSEISVGETVSFVNQSTGTPLPTYRWNFGDGSPVSTDENPSHIYTDEGSYTVVLTATNIYASDVAAGTVDVVLHEAYLPVIMRNLP